MPEPTLTPTVTPTLSPGEQARQLAGKGVTANAGWTPYIEEIDGVKMALVPAGCFPMGSSDEQIAASVALYAQGKKYQVDTIDPSWFAEEKPQHRVCFDRPFWIDVTEVTNGQFEKFGGQSKYPGTYKAADRPRETVSWTESNAFCQKRGARLPTEAEWEYAARGPDGLIFPWGNTWQSEQAVWNAPETASVGSKPGGMSWSGAYDMIGNVNEWVNDWFSQTYYGTLADGAVNPQGPEAGTPQTPVPVLGGGGEMRGIRGSSFYDINPAFLHAAFRARYLPDAEDGTSWSRNSGFRCARSY